MTNSGRCSSARGKKLGCHLDANNAYWAKDVEESRLEVIEAFTPAPDTDLTLAQARAAWPKKVLWINSPPPSTWPPPRASKRRHATSSPPFAPARGLIVGITENIPEDRWRESLLRDRGDPPRDRA